MTSKIVPSNPSEVMVIRKVTENITTFSTPFARFGQAKIGGRGTAVRLQSGALAVFSPTALTPEVKETISSLGQVKYIAAMDMEHHMFVGSWHQEYPEAKVLGPEGLPEKREKQDVEKVRFDHLFKTADEGRTTIDAEFDSEFDYTFVPEHANKELVFNYKRERTLIEADLLFNLPAIEQYSKSPESPHDGIATRLFNSINNIRGDAIWQKRLMWHAISSPDRAGFNRKIAAIDKWDFDRIIPCHGDVIENGGKGVFRHVMQWHLEAAKREGARF